MYKHHSYNNLIEKKLEQLPGPDTEALWSSMEAILDQQMPQKKRRPGVLGWLFSHKAWMLTALSVVSVTGASLVYFGGSNSAAAPHSLRTPHTNNTAKSTVAPTNEATIVPTETTTGNELSSATTVNSTSSHTEIATATTGNKSQVTSLSKTINHNQDASPADRSNTQRGNHHTPAVPTVSGNDQQESANAPVLTTDAAGSTATQWATTTSAIEQEQKTAPAVNAEAVGVNTESLEHLSQQIAMAMAAAKKPGRLLQEKGPYAGVVAGLDLSSVGFRSMETGNNKGLLLGYAFNNRWSVESGLLWNRKKYYAPGEEYKPDGYTAPAGVTMIHVNNISRLYEWPVNLRYNILTGNNKLFATAGVSSYFMKKEAFDLHYRWNGNEYDQYDTYTNASKHWLSVASLSLGYSQKLGSFGTVRVEPYLKLPLRDLGVGNMRVASTGLNVGFTRPLKR